MAIPTRLPKIGLTGPPSAITRSDSSLQSFVATLPIVLTTIEQSTSIVLPARAIEAHVVVNILTAEVTGSNKTINIGINGNVDILIDGANVSAVGEVGKTGGPGESSFPINLSLGVVSNITYGLGSADFVELVAEVILYVITVE